MKNFYFTCFAISLCAFIGMQGISAEKREWPPQKFKAEGVTGFAKSETYKNAVKKDRDLSGKIVGARKVDSTRADDEDPSIEGKWVFVLGDYYDGESPTYGYSYPALYEATLIDGVVTFNSIYDLESPIVADYDEATNRLTFSKRLVSQTALFFEFYIYQDPFVYDYTIDEAVFQTVEATYRPSEGGWIEFDHAMGIEWAVYGTLNPEDDSTYLGVNYIADIEEAWKEDFNELDDSKIWENVGTAILEDGWVLPALGIDQTQAANQYEVPLQHYIGEGYEDALPAVYRLVDPYKVGPAAQYNEAIRPGYIMFDIEDPDCVLVNYIGQDAGFVNRDLGISRFFCYNQAVSINLHYLVTPEELYDKYPGVPRTTLKNGVIELGTGESIIGDFVYDANYGNQIIWYGGLQWYNANQEPLNMTTRIYLPEGFDAGVNGIADDYKAAPKYYNLQGREIKNPERGEIVIKVEGNKTTKIVVR